MQEIHKSQATVTRVWPSLPREVYDDLLEFAKDDRRTPSEMAAIFIENAIKERKRKRNGKTKDNT